MSPHAFRRRRPPPPAAGARPGPTAAVRDPPAKWDAEWVVADHLQFQTSWQRASQRPPSSSCLFLWRKNEDDKVDHL